MSAKNTTVTAVTTAAPAAPQVEWPTMYMPCPVCFGYTAWKCFEEGDSVVNYRCSECSPPIMNLPLPAPLRFKQAARAAA